MSEGFGGHQRPVVASAGRLVGFFDTAGSARDVVVAGDLAFIADGEEGLVIIDVSDCPPCAPDFNEDGLLDFFDVQAFLDAFAAGELSADLVADGVLDFFDLQAFLNLFAVGCA